MHGRWRSGRRKQQLLPGLLLRPSATWSPASTRAPTRSSTSCSAFSSRPTGAATGLARPRQAP